MSSLYANTGCDLDLILYKGTGALTTEIFDDTGTDIGLKYTSGSTGYDLGFVGSSGQDIGRVLGGDVLAVWRSNQTDLADNSDDPISDAWHNVTMFSSDKSKWTKIEKEVEELSIGQHYSSTGLFFSKKKYGAYAFHLMANGDSAEIEVSLGSPSSSDGKVWIAEERSPNTYTKNFVIVGQGGEETKKEWVSAKDDPDGQGYYKYVAVKSSISLTIKLKMGGLAIKSYYAKLSF